MLARNPEKSKKTWKTLCKKKKSSWNPKDHEFFGKLDLWLRKWISEAFVGILSGDTLLYVWDVIFMYNWSKDIFVRLCLSFLGLLRPWLLRATNHAEAGKGCDWKRLESLNTNFLTSLHGQQESVPV